MRGAVHKVHNNPLRTVVKMSFSEYSGSKATVSQAVGRIFKSAHGNLPKLNGTQSQVSALLKSISNVGSNSSKSGSGTERLTKSHTPPSHPATSKFGLQKLRLPGLDKKRNYQHAELLDNQQDAGEEYESGEDSESPLSHGSLIGPPPPSSSQTQKRWPF